MSNNQQKRYRLYIDESGNSDLGHCDDPNHRYLSLCGVIIDLDYIRAFLNDDMNSLKYTYFGKPVDRPIVFHRSDMTNQRKQFIVLKDDVLRHNFNEDLRQHLANWEFTVISVLIDKKTFIERYLKWRENPYHYCLTVMMERYCHFLTANNSIGDTLIESRTKSDDYQLSLCYRHLYEHGTNFMHSNIFQSVLTSSEIKIRKKNENICGLQISDLIAVPIRNRILERYRKLSFSKENYGKSIYEAIYPKIYKDNNKVWGYGLKFLP